MPLPRGSLVVNSSQGGGSKDTWVLAAAEASPEADLGVRYRSNPAPRGPSPAAGPGGSWDDQQQQQQQAGR